LFARARRGAKVFDLCRSARQKRTSLIGGYRNGKLIAPVLFDGTCNTEVFNAWLTSQLLPILEPGTVIVLDNATFHRASTSIQIVQQAQCELLFLPPYSPHINPIEKLWANLKKIWRNQNHLTIDQLIQQYYC
jgi:transposase